MHADAYRCIQMHADAYRCVQMRADMHTSGSSFLFSFCLICLSCVGLFSLSSSFDSELLSSYNSV